MEWRLSLMKGVLVAIAVCAGCRSQSVPTFPGGVVTGTWGGDDAVLMADDTSAHEHIGCTYGNIHQPILQAANGGFDVPGEQDITAYPVDLGVLHPARVRGTIVGNTMTLTVTLTDTAITLGPASLTYGRQPIVGPCPICTGRHAGHWGASQMRRRSPNPPPHRMPHLTARAGTALRVRPAGTLPDPMFTTGVMDLTLPRLAFNNSDFTEVDGELTQAVPWSRTLGARAAVARRVVPFVVQMPEPIGRPAGFAEALERADLASRPTTRAAPMYAG